MIRRRLPASLGVMGAALVVFGGAVFFRSWPGEDSEKVGIRSIPTSSVAAILTGNESAPSTSPPAGLAGADRSSDGKSAEEVASTYQDYRLALALHDRTREDRLYPILLAHRSMALECAHRDLQRATSPEDRELSERTIRFLSDPPGPRRFHRPRSGS